MTSINFSNGYALLIGIGADLPITVKDATALYHVLTHPSLAAYPPEQVMLLTEEKANKQNILMAFDQLIKQANHNPDATVIIYFSGHGGRLDQPGKPAEHFLVPHGYDLDRLADTTISSLEFTAKIEAINARKLVVLLDCCHAGGIPAVKIPRDVLIKPSPILPDLLRILEMGSGRVIVASSRASEYSYTGTPYSIFTTCLLEALAGKASVKKDGFARILDVLIYLLDQVPLRANGSQHPLVNKVLNLDDNFPLCYYAGGDKRVASESASSESSFASTSSETMPSQRFDVYLSYSHTDAEWVEKLAIRLEDEGGLRVWLDKWYLIPGQPWQQELAHSIDQAHCCAVCISESTPTGWFREEIEKALNRQTSDPSFRVIPVLLPNVKTINVNNFLELRTWVDFRSLDISYAFHTLVCGIKGIPPGRWPSRGDTNRGM